MTGVQTCALPISAVFYSGHALEIKRMPYLEPEVIRKGFAREDLTVLTERPALEKFLDRQDFHNANLLMMSSGDYEGLDLAGLKKYLSVQKPS